MAKHTGWMMTAALALAAITGCDAEGQTIGPRGGTLVSEDGRFSLEIPEGALEQELELHIEQVECEMAGALGDCYAVSPEGTAFLFPVEVAYELGDLDLPDAEVGVVAETQDGWRALADQDIDLEDEVVYASSLYLAEYALAIVE